MSLPSISKLLAATGMAWVLGGCAHTAASGTDPVYMTRFDEIVQCARTAGSKLQATEVCVPKYAAAEFTGRAIQIEPAITGQITVVMDEYRTPTGDHGTKQLRCYFDSKRYKDQLLTFTPKKTLVTVRGSLSSLSTSRYIDFVTLENCDILSVGGTVAPPQEKRQRRDPRKKG